MTKVISNQKGFEINSNGNDETILTKDGAEKETDSLDEIKLITGVEYSALSEEDKKNWVRYNPSIQSIAYAQYISMQNQLVGNFNKLGSMIDKLNFLVDDGSGVLITAAEQISQLATSIKTILQPIDSAFDTLDGMIESIKNTEILSPVATPLEKIEEILSSSFQAVVSLSMMVYASIMNPFTKLDSYIQAIREIDWDAMASYFEGEDTPNLDAMAKIEEINFPDEEIKNYIKGNYEQFKAQYENAKRIYQSCEDIHAIEETLTQAKQTYDRAMDIYSTMGLDPFLRIVFPTYEDLKALMKQDYQQMSEKFKQTQYAKALKYSQDAESMVSSTNNFLNHLDENSKYIKTTDVEKLKKIEQEKETA